jgi:hypothetical protein
MARGRALGYEDAVKLLGDESRVVAALGKLAGAGLTLASAGGIDAALGLFELKDEVTSLGQDLVTQVRQRITADAGRTRRHRGDVSGARRRGAEPRGRARLLRSVPGLSSGEGKPPGNVLVCPVLAWTRAPFSARRWRCCSRSRPRTTC